MRSGLQSILDKLAVKITKGMKASQVLTAEFLQAIQDAIHALAEGENIRPGSNIHKRTGKGWVMLSGSPGGSTSSAATACELFPSAGGTPGNPKISVSWGRIVGRQPSGFFAGGIPIFTITPQGTSGYIYAKAELDLESMQWISAEVITSEEVLPNTATIGYVLMGTYKIGKTLTVEGVCGPAELDPCDLDQT